MNLFDVIEALDQPSGEPVIEPRRCACWRSFYAANSQYPAPHSYQR